MLHRSLLLLLNSWFLVVSKQPLLVVAFQPIVVPQTASPLSTVAPLSYRAGRDVVEAPLQERGITFPTNNNQKESSFSSPLLDLVEEDEMDPSALFMDDSDDDNDDDVKDSTFDPSAMFMDDDNDDDNDFFNGHETTTQHRSFSATGLMSPGEVALLTGEQLDSELMASSETPILLDVFATWCGPCKMIAPHVKAAAAELGCQCRVAKIDCERYPEWASKFKVQGLPTVLVLKHGKEMRRLEGAFAVDKLVEAVQPHL